jgi:hypothetical protein
MREAIAGRFEYGSRAYPLDVRVLVLLLAGCAGDPARMAADPSAALGGGAGAGAGSAGGAGTTPAGTAGSSVLGGAGGGLPVAPVEPPDSGVPSDPDDMFHNPTSTLCSDAELATACIDRQCGPPAGSCTQQSCGECDENVPCQSGVCLTPDEFCARSPEMCECLPVMFSLPTRQACSLSLADGTEVDGEAFVEVDGGRHRVLAIDRWGEGHVIAWCDGSTSDQLLMAFEALAYLGRRPTPRFASFGRVQLCDGDWGVEHFEQAPVYLGAELPAQYLGHPELLAADWDVIMFCGFSTMWDPGWAALLQSYVTEHGKGFFAVMDYQGFDVTVNDFTEMNRVMAPSGISFDPVSINWADATADIGITCLPDLTPAVL